MPDPCIVKAGEFVDVTDPRLNDTGCTIEAGVIIRPPADLTVAVPVKRQQAIPKVQQLPPPPPPPILLPVEQVISETVKDQVEEKVDKIPSVTSSPQTTSSAESEVQVENSMDPDVNLTLAMVGGAVAVVGSAAVASSLGGLSAIQTKLASLFGTSKAAVATATVVTAGTIVAVKALEHKMNSLESDLEKTKKEVGDTASSLDRIESLLDRLGN